ncbi:hypothetical protein ABID08_000589 [Rhizobium binae]|uniref:Uncharacterized protein n=1 Tax=Rhizobium binae TaxID=1138190 RepID=A0ABV2M9U7_9HYPH
MLDQKRENPELAAQVGTLKVFARQHGMITVLIAQIDRFFEMAQKTLPGIGDIRLSNPLDLHLPRSQVSRLARDRVFASGPIRASGVKARWRTSLRCAPLT